MRPTPPIPAEIEEYRDARWRREGTRQVESALEAERFIEQIGFAACLTDSRRPGPSLYVAVCGRRDAVMPRNVQKDPEASLTWLLKDEIVKRGKVFWTLGVGRFPDALRRRVSREAARREIARCFLAGAGMTIPGELARVTGLPRPDAGRGNRALVAERYAIMPARGVYRLTASREVMF